MEFNDAEDADTVDDIQECETSDNCYDDSARKNYDIVGQEVVEEEDHISIASHSHLLNDAVHVCLNEVLQDVQLPYELSEFQMLSLHVLGSGTL